MQLDKQTVIDLLRQRGDSGSADQAQSELPDQVDTEQHAGLLEKFGLNPQDLIGLLGGGGGAGGLGKLLGG